MDSDLWLYEIARDTWTRLTTEGMNTNGIWSPDGKQIAFSSNRNRWINLFVIPSDGSAPPRQITTRRSWPFASSWSPDGRVIAVVENHPDTLTNIFLQPIEADQVSKSFLSTPFSELAAVFSPDGHWIAYQSDESGRDEIYVQRFPGPGPRWLISVNGGTLPRWRLDGRELFYRDGDKVMAVDVKLTPQFVAGKPRVLFEGDFEEEYDVTPDGQKFVVVERAKSSPRTELRVVVGLFENLTSQAVSEQR